MILFSLTVIITQTDENSDNSGNDAGNENPKRNDSSNSSDDDNPKGNPNSYTGTKKTFQFKFLVMQRLDMLELITAPSSQKSISSKSREI
jgi:hypothetical protein